jgi:hypothetical protein
MKVKQCSAFHDILFSYVFQLHCVCVGKIIGQSVNKMPA